MKRIDEAGILFFSGTESQGFCQGLGTTPEASIGNMDWRKCAI
ncbi:MAG: hypothetical protein O8C66_05275 [Candidatus Methanoperedens sp.]|nr:hypothetical protein [Candidatus Methanoperedens sp.]MCZ7369902.1 hypothetical protein [Candidatus Methanoperedens sp.]